MAKGVFLVFPGYGHVNPTLPVVRELVRRGEEVIYYSTDEFKERIEETGASFQNYGHDFHAVSFAGTVAESMYALLQCCQYVLDHHVSEVQQVQADYIIFDSLALWGKCIAQLLKLPAMGSVPGIVMTFRLALSTPEMMLSGLKVFLGERARMKEVTTLASHICETYHLEKIDPFDVFTSYGEVNIVYTSKLFHPYAAALDQNKFKFVGATLTPHAQNTPFPFEKLKQEQMIYISLGTLFNQQANLYRTCLEAFADKNIGVIMSIGKQTEKEQLGKIPENVIVEQFVPQIDILQRTSVFITHGGMNSVSEALYYHVPLLVLPRGADQFLIGKRVSQVGAGKVLAKDHVRADILYHSVQEILHDARYTQAAKIIGESLCDAGGYEKAADEIQAFKMLHHLGRKD
jgi:MGT family glycosyltransferase